MSDHLDKLVASGVVTVTRESNGVVRVRLTEPAWRSMLTIVEVPERKPPIMYPCRSIEHERD